MMSSSEWMIKENLVRLDYSGTDDNGLRHCLLARWPHPQLLVFFDKTGFLMIPLFISPQSCSSFPTLFLHLLFLYISLIETDTVPFNASDKVIKFYSFGIK